MKINSSIHEIFLFAINKSGSLYFSSTALVKISAMAEENSSPIIEALNLLELVLHHSPANFHAKLLLISLYHILGEL